MSALFPPPSASHAEVGACYDTHPIPLSIPLTTDDPSYCQRPPSVHLNIPHPTPPRRNHPFSLHLLEWVRIGHGWWGALFGYCPRVGEGEVNDHSWHFYARGDRWTLVVGTTAGSWAEDEWVYSTGEYQFGGEYLSVEGSAGDMDDDDAWLLIEQGLEQWRSMIAEQNEEMVGRWEGDGGKVGGRWWEGGKVGGRGMKMFLTNSPTITTVRTIEEHEHAE